MFFPKTFSPNHLTHVNIFALWYTKDKSNTRDFCIKILIRENNLFYFYIRTKQKIYSEDIVHSTVVAFRFVFSVRQNAPQLFHHFLMIVSVRIVSVHSNRSSISNHTRSLVLTYQQKDRLGISFDAMVNSISMPFLQRA